MLTAATASHIDSVLGLVGGVCVCVRRLLWGQQKKSFSGKGDAWIEEGIQCLQPWGKD